MVPQFLVDVRAQYHHSSAASRSFCLIMEADACVRSQLLSALNMEYPDVSAELSEMVRRFEAETDTAIGVPECGASQGVRPPRAKSF